MVWKIQEAGQGVRSSVDLELPKVFILHNDRQSQKIGGSQHFHQCHLHGYSLAGIFREFALPAENQVSEVKALRFIQVHIGDRLEESFQKLPACRRLHGIERVGQQLEKGILGRQTWRVGVTRLRH